MAIPTTPPRLCLNTTQMRALAPGQTWLTYNNKQEPQAFRVLNVGQGNRSVVVEPLSTLELGVMETNANMPAGIRGSDTNWFYRAQKLNLNA